MRRAFVISMVLLAGMGTAHAQDTGLVREDSITSIVVENDLFAGTDRNYSNGLRFEYVRPDSQAHPWLRQAARLQPFVDLGDPDDRDRLEIRDGFAINHTLYTPDDITLVTPPEDTHPYAGHLALQFFATAAELDEARSVRVENTILIDVGLIGPSAGGEFIQANWHQLIDGEDPLGWDTQLNDELVFAISGQRVERFNGPQFGQVETDLVRHVGLNLGTLRTDLSTSFTLRAGFDLDAGLAAPRLRPAISSASLFRPNRPIGGYVFAGIGGYAVARNVFLDGNTFTDSRSVNKRALVGDLQAGLVLNLGGNRMAFTYVVRSEEFENQNGPQRFGAIALSRAF